MAGSAVGRRLEIMEFIRDYLAGPWGKGIGVAVIAAGVGAMALSSCRNLGPSPAADASRRRTFVCSESGKPFEAKIGAGAHVPVKSPFNGKNTGYEAEFCYWTPEGQVKTEPTPVLLNERMGKPGPSFCPECGRLVRPRNPPAEPGKPPPTRAQYAAGRAKGKKGRDYTRAD